MSVPIDKHISPFITEFSIGGGGPRVAVKDNIDIEGFQTTVGSRVFLNEAPAKGSATVVKRLLAANFKIVGKTKLHELAFGITGLNDFTGTPVNPRFPDLIPGGSSSGSAAAVAAGVAEVAVGTDTGGSIRIPAACCGVYGLKPTFGRVPRDGVTPASSSLDCVGVFARTLDGIESTMEAIDGNFKRQTIKNFKIGVVATESRIEIREAINSAVEKSGAPVFAKSLLLLDAAFSAGLTVIAYETATAFQNILSSPLIGDDVASRLRNGLAVSQEELNSAESIRRSFRKELDDLFEDVDVLAMPTITDFPPELEDAKRDRSAVFLTRNVRPFNLSGNPAIAIPLCPIGGRPVSLQLVGPMGGDALICAAARRIERGLGTV